MKRFLKNLVIIACLVLAYRGLDRFTESKTHLFTTCAISSNLSWHPEWETAVPEDPQALHKILDQPFTFLNSGGQSFVFLSADGQYVLKFFKMYRHRLPLGLSSLCLPLFLEGIREKISAAKNKRFRQEFDSYSLAYREFREESGLVYLHLNKTHFLQQQAHIIDNLGISHYIDLDQTEFLLQKRVTLVYHAIDSLMREGKREAAQHRIEKLVDLLLKRYEKGIQDTDAVIETNYGFDGETPVLLDIGRLQKNDAYRDPHVYRQDFHLSIGRLETWLKANHPSLEIK
jgi:hypothetical protein